MNKGDVAETVQAKIVSTNTGDTSLLSRHAG